MSSKKQEVLRPKLGDVEKRLRSLAGKAPAAVLREAEKGAAARGEEAELAAQAAMVAWGRARDEEEKATRMGAIDEAPQVLFALPTTRDGRWE